MSMILRRTSNHPVSNLSWIKHLQTKGGHVLRFFFGNAGSFPTTVICFPLCFHSIINIASIPSTAQCLSLLYLWKSVLHFSIVSNVVIFSRGHWSVITLISCEKDVSWVTRSFLEQSRKCCLIWKWHNLRFIMDHSLTPATQVSLATKYPYSWWTTNTFIGKQLWSISLLSLAPFILSNCPHVSSIFSIATVDGRDG